MEKEDKIIKEILENGFIEKAPEGFTNKVMQAVGQVELKQKQGVFSGVWAYALLTFAAIFVAFGVLFYFDNNFLSEYFQSFSMGMAGLTREFSNTGKSLLSLSYNFSNLSLFAGVLVVISALLLIEKVVFRKKSFAGVLIW